jgi:SAM-dependent methyltransferase
MDASLFSTQPRGDIPELTRTHWNWYLRKQLAKAISDSLKTAGIGPGCRVLELGCGTRPYESLVLASGAEYYGADLHGNPHADLLIDDAGHVQAHDASFDLVLSIQVLEHVPDPAAYLAESRRLLRTDGWLALSTHGIFIYHPCPLDFWRWTGAGLRRVVEQAGFDIQNFKGIVGLIPAGLHLIQDHLYKRLALRRRWVGKPFVWLMQSLISAADRLHGDGGRANDAMIYIALAQPKTPPSDPV